MNPNEIHQYKPEQRDQDHDQQQLQQQHQGVQEHQATQYYQLTQAQGHRQHVQGYHQQQGQGHQQVHLQGADQQDEVVGPRGERFGSLGNLQFTIIGQTFLLRVAVLWIYSILMRVRILALFNFDADPDPGSALDPGHEHLFMIYC